MRFTPPLIRGGLEEYRVKYGLIPSLPKKAPAPEPTPEPTQYLLSWREILDALDLKNDQKDRVAKLNSDYDGPIVMPGQGAQPKVAKDKLVVWWNGLEARFSEIQQRARDRKASVEAQHDYGRDGTVVPDIGGSVKSRRRQG